MSVAAMFCPRCASPMEWTDGELTCLPGAMGLSQNMAAALISRFGERVRVVATAAAAGRFATLCINS